MDPIKEAFLKIKEEISQIKGGISNLRDEINKINEKIITSTDQIDKPSKNSPPTDTQTHNLALEASYLQKRTSLSKRQTLRICDDKNI